MAELDDIQRPMLEEAMNTAAKWAEKMGYVCNSDTQAADRDEADERGPVGDWSSAMYYGIRAAARCLNAEDIKNYEPNYQFVLACYDHICRVNINKSCGMSIVPNNNIWNFLEQCVVPFMEWEMHYVSINPLASESDRISAFKARNYSHFEYAIESRFNSAIYLWDEQMSFCKGCPHCDDDERMKCECYVGTAKADCPVEELDARKYILAGDKALWERIDEAAAIWRTYIMRYAVICGVHEFKNEDDLIRYIEQRAMETLAEKDGNGYNLDVRLAVMAETAKRVAITTLCYLAPIEDIKVYNASIKNSIDTALDIAKETVSKEAISDHRGGDRIEIINLWSLPMDKPVDDKKEEVSHDIGDDGGADSGPFDFVTQVVAAEDQYGNGQHTADVVPF